MRLHMRAQAPAWALPAGARIVKGQWPLRSRNFDGPIKTRIVSSWKRHRGCAPLKFVVLRSRSTDVNEKRDLQTRSCQRNSGIICFPVFPSVLCGIDVPKTFRIGAMRLISHRSRRVIIYRIITRIVRVSQYFSPIVFRVQRIAPHGFVWRGTSTGR